MKSRSHWLTVLAGACVAIAPATTVWAANAAATDTLDEVVVTAQKRAESIQSVPVSITLVDEKQLERQGITSLTDLSKASSSLEFASASRAPGGGGIMRGIGTVSFNPTAQASVGLVVDGVVTNGAYSTSLFDLDRIEVLKGPQGTLFGGTVSAGVISMSTKKPQLGVNSFHFNAEVADKNAGSDFSRTVLRGVANFSAGSSSAVRIAAHSNQDNGIFRNTYQKLDSSGHDNGIRARWLLQSSDRVSLNVIGEYNDFVERDYPTLVYRTAAAGSGVALALNDCGGIVASPSNSNFCSDRHYLTKIVTRALSAQLDLGVADNTLTLIASARGKGTQGHGDIIGIALPITQARFTFANGTVPVYGIYPGGYPGNPQSSKFKQNAFEARLASPLGQPVEWLAGVFGQTASTDYENPGLFQAIFIAGGAFPIPTGTFGGTKSDEYAAFGNATWHLRDATRLIVGARYTKVDVQETKLDIGNTSATFPGYRGPFKLSANKFTFRLGAQRNFSGTEMGYVTLATGFKGPQISDDFANGKSYFGVDAEEPTSIEVGLKSSLLDNRLAVNVDVFYNHVKNYQGQVCTPATTGITCLPTNVPTVNSKGFEVEVFGRPTERWNVSLSASYNPAKYPKGSIDEFGQDQSGTQLTYSTRTKVAGSAEYSWPVSDRLKMSIGADATYRGSIAQYPALGSRYIVPSSTIANLRVGLKSDANWSVAAFMRNVGRENYPRELFPPLFQLNTALWQVFDANSKRVVGLQFDMGVGEK